MKKIILLLSIIFFSAVSLFAKGVDVTTASNVAKNFYANKANIKHPLKTIALAYQFKIETSNGNAKQAAENAYYIFNVNEHDGFIIVSGSDAVTPVLGYSNEGTYSTINISPSFRQWVESYKNQILYAEQNNLTAPSKVKSQWTELINGTSSARVTGVMAVNPLLSTTWDQGNNSNPGYYNDQCPVDDSLPDANNLSHHCVTGCVATAMAQVMKYWNYPTKGTGIHSYNSNYGTLTADFGSTTYDWASMTNSVTSTNPAVATLMYHCGVSVEMQYTRDESGAYVIATDSPVCAQNAYITYFGYDPAAIQGLSRANYNDNDWTNLLKNELDHSRPLQYAGQGSGGGHTFVCDGYDANNFFHMNWGWSGFDDGFFALDSLNPSSLGAGGGTGGFNFTQQAVIGIQPVSGGGSSGGGTGDSLQLNSAITPSTINFGQPFSVTASVQNVGVNGFSGALTAGLFSTNGNLITFIDSMGSNISSGNSSGSITFTSNGLLTVPGTYNIQLLYKPTGKSWESVYPGVFTNPVSVTINGPQNNLQLSAVIMPTPSTFIQGQNASVSINVLNNNSYTYFGAYVAELYDLNGNPVQQLGNVYSESSGLASGASYNAAINLGDSVIRAVPGTYILAVFEQESDSTHSYLIGSPANYANPINVIVQAPALSPDSYEPDNTPATAHEFPLTWNNNAASVKTTGSNINVASDYDYYKISLDTGYSYVIHTQVYNNDTTVNGQTYTCHTGWSYSYDNTGIWSPSYDKALVTINDTVRGNAKTITYFVSPYFAGLTGTYLLNIDATRVALTHNKTGINNINDQGIAFEVYPNPASDYLQIRYSGNTSTVTLRVINYLGQIVLATTQSGEAGKIDVSTLPNGIYSLEANNGHSNYSSKFIINR